jgi:Lhr-like helicase
MKNKDYYWITKDGRKINVDDMDVQHLRNTLKMIIRNIEAVEKKEKSKFKFELHGEIAQDHLAQMEDEEYYNNASEYEY